VRNCPVRLTIAHTDEVFLFTGIGPIEEQLVGQSAGLRVIMLRVRRVAGAATCMFLPV
jgi:hypothetical protein